MPAIATDETAHRLDDICRSMWLIVARKPRRAPGEAAIFWRWSIPVPEELADMCERGLALTVQRRTDTEFLLYARLTARRGD